MLQPAQPAARRTWWMLAVSLAVLCAAVRLPGLLALPIFGDEAIYLRWAQLIRDGHFWVSLCDPKPPLHFWLLAMVVDLFADPLRAGRLLSVAAAALSMPVMLLIGEELDRLCDRQPPALPGVRPMEPGSDCCGTNPRQNRGLAGEFPGGRTVAVLAAVLMIFCPFFAFYQRMALAESLFVFEMLLIVWLSLRWARIVVAGQRAWGIAVMMGVCFAAAMMTRQGLPYVLWAMPIGAFLLHFIPPQKTSLRTAVPGLEVLINAAITFLIAVIVAAILWSPYLVAHLPTFAESNGGVRAELKRRIFYQPSFTDPHETRTAIALRNGRDAFEPSVHNDVPQSGWLFYYLTPPVYVVSLLGIALLAMRRQWRLLAFVLLWLALTLLFPIVMLSTFYSRYILAGTVPLLIAAAYALAECLIWSSRLSVPWSWTAALLLFASLLIAPIRQLGLQSTHWQRQVMVGHDTYQYLAGWTAGGPAQLAIQTLRQLAATEPITVITDDTWGTPADAVWLYLARDPRVTLYFTRPDNDGAILQPAPNALRPNTFLLKKDKWLYLPESPVELSPDERIYYITNDPVHTGVVEQPAETFFRPKNPNLGHGISFVQESLVGGEHVMLFQLEFNDTSASQENPQE
ncbi:MAG: glycosyltransferase family 39 protein [Phycisphaerales bacterium]|nr:glycosyltransferase family 39 protein [Phycisphaerales bacterium]